MNHDWTSAMVEINGIRLHHTRTGGNKSPLVLAHGFTDDRWCWQTLVEALSERFDVIFYDARGHGHSSDPEHAYKRFDHANDLAGLIAAIGLKRPAILGHSMGAITALTLAGAFPELPSAILLEDPPPFWTQQDESAASMKTWINGVKRQNREELVQMELQNSG